MRNLKQYAEAVVCGTIAVLSYELIKTGVKVVKDSNVVQKAIAQVNKEQIVNEIKKIIS